MKPKSLWLALLFLLSQSGCVFLWVRNPDATANIKGTLTVPLRVVGDVLLAKVRVNGEGPFWFFIDTGAPVCAVSQKFSEKIQKKRYSRVNVNVGGAIKGKTQAKMLRFDGLELGGATFHDVLAVELDLSQVESAMGVELGGILGLSLFEDFLLTIDYPNERLVLEEGKLPKPNQQDIFAYTTPNKHIAIPMTFNGTTFEVTIDTGSNTAIALPEDKAKALRFHSAPVRDMDVLTSVGRASQWAAQLKGDLLVGRYAFPEPVVSLLNTDEPSMGGPLLKNFVFTIDQKQKTIMMALSEDQVAVRENAPRVGW